MATSWWKVSEKKKKILEIIDDVFDDNIELKDD